MQYSLSEGPLLGSRNPVIHSGLLIGYLEQRRVVFVYRLIQNLLLLSRVHILRQRKLLGTKISP